MARGDHLWFKGSIRLPWLWQVKVVTSHILIRTEQQLNNSYNYLPKMLKRVLWCISITHQLVLIRVDWGIIEHLAGSLVRLNWNLRRKKELQVQFIIMSTILFSKRSKIISRIVLRSEKTWTKLAEFVFSKWEILLYSSKLVSTLSKDNLNKKINRIKN